MNQVTINTKTDTITQLSSEHPRKFSFAMAVVLSSPVTIGTYALSAGLSALDLISEETSATMKTTAIGIALIFGSLGVLKYEQDRVQ